MNELMILPVNVVAAMFQALATCEPCPLSYTKMQEVHNLLNTAPKHASLTELHESVGAELGKMMSPLAEVPVTEEVTHE